MGDIKKIAIQIMKKTGTEINPETIKKTIKELETCRRGRKVRVLIALEKVVRLNSTELSEKAEFRHSNIGVTNLLLKNLLVEKYDESAFKPPYEVNYTYRYWSITDLGRELIEDLGRDR